MNTSLLGLRYLWTGSCFWALRMPAWPSGSWKLICYNLFSPFHSPALHPSQALDLAFPTSFRPAKLTVSPDSPAGLQEHTSDPKQREQSSASASPCPPVCPASRPGLLTPCCRGLLGGDLPCLPRGLALSSFLVHASAPDSAPAPALLLNQLEVSD